MTNDHLSFKLEEKQIPTGVILNLEFKWNSK